MNKITVSTVGNFIRLQYKEESEDNLTEWGEVSIDKSAAKFLFVAIEQAVQDIELGRQFKPMEIPYAS